ncbi:HAD-IIA family hydrolase [Actinotalea sp. M2MS4P-6]|uniref:HAD-IIA family hydrolase n=1 Tax=Actinotalea sp. M2MS4P-6 TaxID=2983762 RepID=UPI0021E456D0|nr:HAD-IIA family hydrolase [Actinotalea sp. M2MS4P-6]MCV2393370.1 HAD-IIA family hydrolase [Actinotalea sp. M2MS4P-6]
MSVGLLGADRPLAELHDLALVDLDGVAYRGKNPIPYAAEGLAGARGLGMHLVFVTNNSSREPGSVAEQLTGLDIPCDPIDVMTAAQAAAAVLADRLDLGSRVLVVGGAGLATAVREAGFEVVSRADARPAAVVQGYAADVGWPQLAEATYAIRAGAWFVASNLDRTLPTEHGFAPGNGSLVAAVQTATDVVPTNCGKPEPTMYQLAARRHGARNPLVVGDRLDTDLAGARAADYPGLHVITGVSSARDAVLARPAERPHYLAADLRGLLTTHPAPLRDGEWWRCGSAAARVTDGRLELADRGTLIDRARAACAAGWDAADTGAPFDPDTVPDLAVDEA